MAAILLYLYRRLKAKESSMPTTMNRNTGRIADERVLSQKVCIALGIFFVFVGLTGIVTPGLLGMHLSFIHNSIHLASGALAIWTGYSDNTKRSYAVCVSLGLLYSVIGVLGFVMGSPGYPNVGYAQMDQYLLRIVPNAFEIGTSDHLIHMLIGVTFLIGAVFTKKSH
jgi:hypothetical protein